MELGITSLYSGEVDSDSDTCERYFFFQAEDGIRDLVRSRGLGDVYKRQVGAEVRAAFLETTVGCSARDATEAAFLPARGGKSVSYTHLTLPTSDLV